LIGDTTTRSAIRKNTKKASPARGDEGGSGDGPSGRGDEARTRGDDGAAGDIAVDDDVSVAAATAVCCGISRDSVSDVCSRRVDTVDFGDGGMPMVVVDVVAVVVAVGVTVVDFDSKRFERTDGDGGGEAELGSAVSRGTRSGDDGIGDGESLLLLVLLLLLLLLLLPDDDDDVDASGAVWLVVLSVSGSECVAVVLCE
jgi:hypothetical protein